MKRFSHYMLLFVCLFHTLPALAQFDPDKVCRIENGQLIFSLNLKWSEKEKKEVSALFDLDSLLIAKVYNGISEIAFEGENWRVKKVKTDLLELSKPIQSKPGKNLKINDIFLVLDDWMNFAGGEAETSVIYGTNNFEIPYVFSYKGNKARFYLPAYKSANKVFISGTFNGWGTTQTPMQHVSDGWMIDLNLKPGKYGYKYIIDGKRITDPNNNVRERNSDGGYNSVVFCCNHLFGLNGFKDARRVVVTGNFYNWNPRGIIMHKTDRGWSLPIYLRDGTYAYKFLVDNQWMPDPENKDVRKDADGNLNSFIGIGQPYIFKLGGNTTAGKVVLSGSFNGWNQVELIMDKTDKGWQLPYVIAAGNWEYKFIVDGKWMVDPSNPFSNGSGDGMNSFIALKANHLFELKKFPDAGTVIVTGSFNHWDTQGYRMIKEGGRWIFPYYLRPGKYTYKFIVDGNWILDPSNSLYEQNEYGTNNSVLWIDPAQAGN